MTQAPGSNDVASAVPTYRQITGPRAASGVTGVTSADAPGCEGTSRLTHSWMRQAAYVDWGLQVQEISKTA